jgi:chaperone required for assembly of F1-ATPase
VKRFWNDVGVEAEDGGWAVRLDAKAVKTPSRAPLTVPSRTLADAIADEWRSIEGEIDPRRMPLTGLANAAIDRVAPAKDVFASGLARYVEADLACYRAEGPKELIDRQEEQWNALLSWGRRRFDVDFATTTGVTHVTQPPATVERLSYAVSALDAFRLAGLSPLVTISGSLVGGLAVLEKAMAPEGVWAAVSLDDQWQLERWGSDAEAETALENRRRDFMAGARFLDLLS